MKYFTSDGMPMAEDDRNDLIEESIESWKKKEALSSFVIALKKNKQKIGFIALTPQDELPPTHANFAIVMSPAFQGKGFGTEATEAVLQYAKLLVKRKQQTIYGKPFRAISATVSPHNTASTRLLQRMGFTEKTKTSNQHTFEYPLAAP